jgi:hypothetical protein
MLWAEKAMDGVVPDDIARDKQAQLAQTLSHFDMQIAQLAQLGDLERESLEAGLRLVADCGRAYSDGDEALRRACNQSWFDFLGIDDDGDRVHVADVRRHDYAEALHTAQVDRADAVVARDVISPRSLFGYRVNSHVAGSNVATLVGVTGFEPAASSSRTKRATKLRHTPWPTGV